MKAFLLLTLSLMKLAFQVGGVDGLLGFINDQCEDDTWCMVIRGICDSRLKKCVCRDGYVQNSLFTCVKATKLGENCIYDVQCQRKDPNSHCSSLHDQRYQILYRCACKLNYHLEIINNTEICVLGKTIEDDKEGLTAAPIILCFMGCVIVEALCLLAFRYWKKHRRAEFRRHETLQLETHSLTDTRIPSHLTSHAPFISFMMPPLDPLVSGAGPSSPPPYNQTDVSGGAIQAEEPPPTYEEAMKQYTSTSVANSESVERRKMSY